jgi:hypothetical protein
MLVFFHPGNTAKNYKFIRSQDSSVGTATGYGLDNQGWIPGRDNKFFSSSKGLDRLWCPCSLLSKGYWGLFSRR